MSVQINEERKKILVKESALIRENRINEFFNYVDGDKIDKYSLAEISETSRISII